jgi:hypothetical protein
MHSVLSYLIISKTLRLMKKYTEHEICFLFTCNFSLNIFQSNEQLVNYAQGTHRNEC